MDYEKKYKDALRQAEETIKYYKERNRDEAAIEDLQVIFPELKESEDERIRKELIKLINNTCKGEWFIGSSKEECLAWLEKQGEKKKSYDTCDSSMMDKKKSPYGEKKDFGYFKEKIADKIEPKFNVGDWIVNQHGTIRHIEEVGNVGYQTDKGWLTHDCYEKDFHLWTIQDAKDMDILSYENEVFIVKKSVNLNILYYCCYDGEHFIIDSFYSLTIDDINNIRPATKEQRELLFKKMHEAGYMWDSNSKQLLSLKAEPSGEQKPIKWSEEDDNNLTDTCVAIRKFYHGTNGAQELIDWLQSLKQRCTWKPSDNELEVLRLVAKKDGTCLMGLYEQLKKL